MLTYRAQQIYNSSQEAYEILQELILKASAHPNSKSDDMNITISREEHDKIGEVLHKRLLLNNEMSYGK